MGSEMDYSFGVLAYHVIGEEALFSGIKANILCADGNHDYTVLFDGLDPNQTPYIDRWHKWDIVDKDTANPYNGYNERERICIRDGQGSFYQDGIDTVSLWLAAYQYALAGEQPSRGPYQAPTNMTALRHGADHIGDKFDLFKEGDIISPFTNPPA